MPEAAPVGYRGRWLRQDGSHGPSRGLSQEELAFKAGLHRTYLSSAERGQRNVGLVNIERLARALDIDISDLFDRG